MPSAARTTARSRHCAGRLEVHVSIAVTVEMLLITGRCIVLVDHDGRTGNEVGRARGAVVDRVGAGPGIEQQHVVERVAVEAAYLEHGVVTWNVQVGDRELSYALPCKT